jgi:hypothetical protein
MTALPLGSSLRPQPSRMIRQAGLMILFNLFFCLGAADFYFSGDGWFSRPGE